MLTKLYQKTQHSLQTCQATKSFNQDFENKQETTSQEHSNHMVCNHHGCQGSENIPALPTVWSKGNLQGTCYFFPKSMLFLWNFFNFSIKGKVNGGLYLARHDIMSRLWRVFMEIMNVCEDSSRFRNDSRHSQVFQCLSNLVNFQSKPLPQFKSKVLIFYQGITQLFFTLKLDDPSKRKQLLFIGKTRDRVLFGLFHHQVTFGHVPISFTNSSHCLSIEANKLKMKKVMKQGSRLNSQVEVTIFSFHHCQTV